MQRRRDSPPAEESLVLARDELSIVTERALLGSRLPTTVLQTRTGAAVSGASRRRTSAVVEQIYLDFKLYYANIYDVKAELPRPQAHDTATNRPVGDPYVAGAHEGAPDPDPPRDPQHRSARHVFV